MKQNNLIVVFFSIFYYLIRLCYNDFIQKVGVKDGFLEGLASYPKRAH